MPTLKQLKEMDAFFAAVSHPDYDYDWLCPHGAKGCDDCWGPGWLEDYDKEHYGPEGEDIFSEHPSETGTSGEGNHGRTVAVPSEPVGGEERGDPFVLLPLERVHDDARNHERSRRYDRRRLGKFDSGR